MSSGGDEILEAIEYLEERLCETFPKAREWIDAGKSQQARNDDAQENWGRRPPPCAYELLVGALWKFHPAAIVKGAIQLTTNAPTGFAGTNFARLVLDYVEPEQRSIQEKIRTREALDRRAAGEQTQLPEYASRPHDPPEHGDGVWIYKRGKGADGEEETYRDTIADSRSAFGSIVRAAMQVGERVASGHDVGTGRHPCVCGERFENRTELEEHAVIHYPPGARAYWTERLGLDLARVERKASEVGSRS